MLLSIRSVSGNPHFVRCPARPRSHSQCAEIAEFGLDISMAVLIRLAVGSRFNNLISTSINIDCSATHAD